MKEITGYLIARDTGLGVASKPVSFLRLDGSAVPVGAAGTLTYGSKDSITAGDGRFTAWWELSPGPVNVEVVAATSPPEKKIRKHNEKAQLGWQWSSDISRLARASGEGIVPGFLNEFILSCPGGQVIRVGTGEATFNGGVFSIESGAIDLTGTPNAGPANPRYDLITLRQYNENASGQDAGRQTIWITEGTVTSTVPPTPTGVDFKDLPIGFVSTAIGAGKTLPADWDLRTRLRSTLTPLAKVYEYEAAQPVAGAGTHVPSFLNTTMDSNEFSLPTSSRWAGQIIWSGTTTGSTVGSWHMYVLAFSDGRDSAGVVVTSPSTDYVLRPPGGNYKVRVPYLDVAPFSFTWPIQVIPSREGGRTWTRLRFRIMIAGDTGSNMYVANQYCAVQLWPVP